MDSFIGLFTLYSPIILFYPVDVIFLDCCVKGQLRQSGCGLRWEYVLHCIVKVSWCGFQTIGVYYIMCENKMLDKLSYFCKVYF